MNTDSGPVKKAILYRMATPENICPYGLRSLALLRRQEFEIDDRLLKTREETDVFKKEHNVKTTPQTFIDGKRIGGFDDLKSYFGESAPDPTKPTYAPVIAVFTVAFLMSVALGKAAFGKVGPAQTFEWFIAISLCMMATQKLRDLFSFANDFLRYDLLARRFPRYAYAYPFAEAAAGILILAGAWGWLAALIVLLMGAIGAVSVVKAVILEKRELKCACVGGQSKVPLGAIALIANLVLAAMGVWLLAKPYF